MKQIRVGVFETNSSSTHSLTIKNRKLSESNLPVSCDGNIYVESGEFGWGYEEKTSQYDKLSYLVTMMFSVGGYCRKLPENVIDIYHSESFILLDKEIFEHSGHHIILEEVDLGHNSVNVEGYIDHQSCEDYNSLKDFLDSNQITVKEFVFGDTTMVIDSDN